MQLEPVCILLVPSTGVEYLIGVTAVIIGSLLLGQYY
jgi:hypothetical protein